MTGRINPKDVDLRIEYLKQRQERIRSKRNLTPRMLHDLEVIERKLDLLIAGEDKIFYKDEQYWEMVRQGKITLPTP